MNERAEQILEAAVEGFIGTGEPVSSGWLYDHYDFGIKPAMIRLELDELEEAGYLEQPHHSAGRVPTDAGYEFFTDRILGSARSESPRGDASHRFLDERALPDLLKELSEELELLSVAADLASRAVYKCGLQELVRHLDWGEREDVNEVIRDFEEVDARLPRAVEKLRAGPKVFIGKKSPVTRSEQLSVVGKSYDVNGASISILLIGPKRMDYKKAIHIFRNL